MDDLEVINENDKRWKSNTFKNAKNITFNNECKSQRKKTDDKKFTSLYIMPSPKSLPSSVRDFKVVQKRQIKKICSSVERLFNDL